MATRYVTPAGSGTQAGTSWADAAPWSAMQAQHDALAHGDEIHVLAGVEHPHTTALNWTKRIAVRGKKTDGTDGYAVIVGSRTFPWPANGVWTDSGAYVAAISGAAVFNYKDGAGAVGGTTFAWLAFRNTGTAIKTLFSAATVTGTLTVNRLKAYNVEGLCYQDSSGDGQVSITASNCRATGYSKGMFRSWGNMHLTDCHGDSRRQFHSPTTNIYGAHVQDAIQGVTMPKATFSAVRCSFLNHAASAPTGSSRDPAVTGNYMQGDGIIVEENTTFLPSSDIYTSGNADRGIDIKCAVPDGNLTRVYSTGDNFGIGVHDDLVETVVTDSWIGNSYTPTYQTAKVATVQGSGWLTAKRCYLHQPTPEAGQPAGKFFIAAVTGQAEHLQSGVTIPNRVGKHFVRDSIRHQGTGVGLANIASIAFGTPTYTETNTRPA